MISTDQTAYIKGRYIGENIRTISDIIEYCKYNNLTCILVLIDFEKAFDSIRWSFLFKTLEVFGFGNNLIKWVQILYKSPNSRVVNNGYFSDCFCPERGIRQGCPLSAYLFILSVELLAIKLRNSQTVQGISVNNNIIKINQFADDTTLILKDTNSIRPALGILKSFYICSGLKTNIDKTQAFFIGENNKTPEHKHNFKWSKDPIHLLGITLYNNENENYKWNFEDKIKKIRNLLNMWKQRSLSLKGKIVVINSLAASMLVYPCTVIETPARVIKEVTRFVYGIAKVQTSLKIL